MDSWSIFFDIGNFFSVSRVVFVNGQMWDSMICMNMRSTPNGIDLNCSRVMTIMLEVR